MVEPKLSRSRLGLGKTLVVLDNDIPAVRVHESGRGSLPLAGHLAHLRARDGLEVVLFRGIEEVHRTLHLVVGSELERKELELLRKHRVELQHCLAMPLVVHVITQAWLISVLRRVLHACRVTADDVVRRSAEHARGRVPLHLPRTAVDHGRGKMASTTSVSPNTLFLMIASCCAMRTSKGTSSSFVQPPRGESHNTGFL